MEMKKFPGFSYGMIQGDAAVEFAEDYSRRLKEEGFEGIRALSTPEIDSEKYLVNDNPFKRAFAVPTLISMGLRNPSLKKAAALAAMDKNCISQGNYSSIALLVLNDSGLNSHIAKSLESQLKEVHGDIIRPTITSLNNVKPILDKEARFGISLAYRHPETVPRARFNPTSGSRFLELFSDVSAESSFPYLPWDNGQEDGVDALYGGVSRVYFIGGRGVYFGGGNLAGSDEKGRWLVVEDDGVR